MADHFMLWFAVAQLLLIGLSLYVLRIENEYRDEFSLPLATVKSSLLSIVVACSTFSVLAVVSKSSLVALNLVSMAVAAAALRGVWRIDRICLLIPNRLQLMGTLAGLLFLVVQIISGEPGRDVLFEAFFGLMMVSFMWGLSYVYLRLRGSIGFGLGDTKLLAWLALFVGRRMSDVILTAIFLGLLWLLGLAVKKSIKEKRISFPASQEAFAFGPSIVWAAILVEIFHYA